MGSLAGPALQLCGEGVRRLPLLSRTTTNLAAQDHASALLRFWKTELQTGLTWLNSRRWQGCVPSGGSGGDSISSSSPGSRSRLRSWLTAPSCISEASRAAPSTLSPTLLPSSYEDRDHTGPTWISPLNTLNLIIPAKSLLPHKVTYAHLCGGWALLSLPQGNTRAFLKISLTCLGAVGDSLKNL